MLVNNCEKFIKAESRYSCNDPLKGVKVRFAVMGLFSIKIGLNFKLFFILAV